MFCHLIYIMLIFLLLIIIYNYNFWGDMMSNVSTVYATPLNFEMDIVEAISIDDATTIGIYSKGIIKHVHKCISRRCTVCINAMDTISNASCDASNSYILPISCVIKHFTFLSILRPYSVFVFLYHVRLTFLHMLTYVFMTTQHILYLHAKVVHEIPGHQLRIYTINSYIYMNFIWP